MHTLFFKDYSSEELYDLCRDVSECFDHRFNKEASTITSESTFYVTFIYTYPDKSQKILLRSSEYFLDNCSDIENDLFDSVAQVNDQKDSHGFHLGTFILAINFN